MAVSKMEKLTILSAADQQEKILQTIQGIQAVEMKNFQHSTIDEAYLSRNFPLLRSKNEENKIPYYQRMLHDIQESILFLSRYTEGKGSSFKRQNRTLSSLEEAFDERRLQQQLERIQQLRDQLSENETEKQRVREAERFLARWQYLDIHPNEVHSSMTVLKAGTINDGNQAQLEQLLADFSLVYKEEVYRSPHHIYYCFIVLEEEAAAFNEILSKVSFSPIQYTYAASPKTAYEETKQEMAQLLQEELNLKAQIKKCQQSKNELYLAEEMVYAYLNREEAKHFLMTSDYFFLLQGWLPADEIQTLKASFEKEGMLDEIYLTFEAPTKEEILEDIPVKLKNHKIVAPFEMLTEMYRLPKYDEIDPTPWMTPFYMVFFGMMVADLGYGLLMLIATILIKQLFVLSKSFSRFIDFFFILSFPTIIWGLIYGSFFGAALPQEIAGISLPFPLLSTTDDVITILVISVIFGFIQLMVGLMLGGVELAKRKEYLSSVGEGFGWQGLLVGIALAVVGKLFLTNDGLFLVGILLAVISAIAILMVPVLQSASKVKGVAKGLYNLYGLTGYIGDLVSYTRLMALGISGGSIAAAFNLLVGFMPPVARYSIGILLIIVLHALNIFLSILGAYVHGIRLQYVEFFGKFYNGGGRAFQPLKTEEKYINIEKKNK